MHRYPRVDHAGNTYMVGYKIDRSILTEKFKLTGKQMCNRTIQKCFKSDERRILCKLVFQNDYHPSKNAKTFNINGLYEILESLQRKV